MTEPWVVVRVETSASRVELVADVLWQHAAAAIEERSVGERVTLLAAFADPHNGRAAAEAIGGTLSSVEPTAGLDEWRVHAAPIVVGRLTIRPTWLDPLGAALEIAIDPGHAFGSGSHPTTRQILAWLERTIVGGERILDVGCGSGILAISALALGASTASAVDIDAEARRVTSANAASNGVAHLVTLYESLDRVCERVDVVLANIGAGTISTLAVGLRAATAPDGHLVVAGFRADRQGAVIDAVGWPVVDTSVDDGWPVVVLARP